ncbi:FtsK/SpoIIIE domain-containing protein [Herbidospora mongoliensis]|uniref:FtsK/SpoIIIE domain-containing protein n=1 Tax=Herbidospora mongoliensis TaxID=688067 RepID=UPI000B02046A|nr:FtsK/SpoIIIE domain-containing protein [Herbidospora mongoliensis]
MILRKLPGQEIVGVVSTRPDTTVVFAPTVVRTPAIVTVVVWLWRLLAGSVRLLWRHPVACAVPVVTGWLWSFGAWQLVAFMAADLSAIAALVAWAYPHAFGRWVGWPLVAWWRWVWVYRRKWQSVMVMAGLSGNFGGRLYLPDLVRVRCDARCDTVRVRMLAGQAVEQFTDHAPNLSNGFGAPRVRITSPKPGWVTLIFPRADVLAGVIPAMPIPVRPWVGPVEIGLAEDGASFRLQVHGTHVLIAGATGSGKGSWLWGIVRGLLPACAAGIAQAWGLDPKLMELSFGRELFDQYAGTPEQCAELLEQAVALMQERARRYAGVRRNHIPTMEDPFVLVLVDEIAFLTAYQPDKALRLRISAALATLTTQGRAVGIAVVAALQDPRKEVLNIRNLFPDKVALRLDEPGQVDMVLGDGARDRGAVADQIPRDPDDPSVGAGEAYVRLENSPDPVRVRAGYVSDADIQQMCDWFGGRSW